MPDATLKSESGWRWWVGVLAGPVATILLGIGVLKWLGEAITGKTIAVVVGITLWSVAMVVTVYLLLKRELHRAVDQLRGRVFDMGLPDTGSLSADPRQAASRLYVEMRTPTFRSRGDQKVTAEFWVGTHERLPEDTKLVRWSVKFTLAGYPLDEWRFEKRDITLQSVGRTQLYPNPEVPAPKAFLAADLKGQLDITCEVFLLVRVSGLPDQVKVNEIPATQICRVQ